MFAQGGQNPPPDGQRKMGKQGRPDGPGGMMRGMRGGERRMMRGMKRGGKRGGGGAAPVYAGQVQKKVVPLVIEAIGAVEPIRTTAVRSQVTGTLVKIAITEGQNVTQGDLLFEIDPRPFKNALQSAEADLQKSRLQQIREAVDFGLGITGCLVVVRFGTSQIHRLVRNVQIPAKKDGLFAVQIG